MSLATLKVKVQKLIEQAMYKKYWQKLWNNEPIDFTIPDSITIPYEAWYFGVLPLMSKLSGKNVTNLTASDLSDYATEELMYVDLPKLSALGDELFYSASKLEEVNTPSATTMGVYVFRNCRKLSKLKVGKLTSTERTSFRITPKSTQSHIEFLEIGKGTSASLYLQDSLKYSQETLHNLIDNLADMTGQEAPVFSVGPTNLAKISDEYLQKLTDKNWTYT